MAQKLAWKGKRGGNHSTVIDPARSFITKIAKHKEITKISPGFISTGKHPSGLTTVKISVQRGSILLGFRGASSHQEFRIFSDNYARAVEIIEDEACQKKFNVIVSK